MKQFQFRLRLYITIKSGNRMHRTINPAQIPGLDKRISRGAGVTELRQRTASAGINCC